MERNLGNTSPAQAAAAGWVVDKGDPGAWETVAKAHNDGARMMKSTKRLRVDGGYLYQVSTEGPGGYAEALAFVPDPGAVVAALEQFSVGGSL